MKRFPTLLIVALVGALSGCLEVEQHPAWVDGRYDGKQDDLQSRRYFSRDKLAWSAAIADRNRLQNEYLRSQPK